MVHCRGQNAGQGVGDDLDGHGWVKQINDTYGYAFGAYTISETGGLIKAAFEKKGLASRFGGDEFMAFMPDVQAEEAYQVAEAIRTRVGTLPYEKEGVSVRPTICIGIINLSADDNMTSLFKRADKALYRSKRTGRNKVSVAE